MILDSLFLQNDILGASMQASIARDAVITNNIANAEVPDYKKKAVQFESYLREALDNGKIKSSADLAKIVPKIWVEHTGYSYRIDGNNVDIENEMVDLYQNSVRYDTMAQGIMNNYRRINSVLTGIK